MRYRTGHIADHQEVVKLRAGLHLHPDFGAMQAIGSLPLFTSNRAKLPTTMGGPGIVNQTDASGCEGCANASGATLQLALDGTPLDEPISHVGSYVQALMALNVLNPDGTLPWLIDTGTSPAAVQAGWAAFGGAPRSVWGQLPMSSGTMYSKAPGAPSGALIQPTVNQLYAGRQCRLQNAYFLSSSGPALVRDVMRVMASRKVLTNAINGSAAAFQSYTGGVIGALGGEIDHAQLMVDYEWLGDQASLDAFMAGDDSKVNLVIFHGDNSWGGVGCPDGGDWGEVDAINQLGGQYRANAAFAQEATDWCVLDVRRIG